ncbi:hypothetical protein AJ80_07213 [Polytolypa hystricis UAMH7299]|uniref:Pentatricopeptide repeat domain-containing protein n=1 Tax=Polytolypa hystricis (strain UAMH7299) TaxID=1447883 RepID=A0A2B7XRI1_POLH7|nr:hypothetical protein AJ80_07213 [Polytolypa hystricis UAMH7299]
MRSHLTQGVFRAIVENRPYSHPRCRRHLALLLSRGTPGCRVQIAQRRSFFGFPGFQRTGNEKDGIKQEVSMDLAASRMAELVYSQQQRSRPPAPFVLAQAFMGYIQNRLEQPGILTQHQARLLWRTFEHLIAEHPYEEASGSVRLFLEISNLEDTLTCLSESEFDRGAQKVVSQLASSVFRQIRNRLKETEADAADHAPSVPAVSSYIKVLCSSGSSAEAMSVIESFRNSSLKQAGLLPWIDVIQGFAAEGTDEAATMVLEKMAQLGIKLHPRAHEEIAAALTQKHHIGVAKKIYESMIENGLQPTVAATAATINVALRNSMVEWARQIFNTLPPYPTPETRDIILLFEAVEGYGTEHIINKLESLVSTNPKVNSGLTIATVNQLMEYADEIARYDLVEEYASMATRLGLYPDSQTHLLLANSRLQAGDVVGAVRLFQDLGPEVVEHMDIGLANRLISELCNADNADFNYDSVLYLVDRIIEANGRFEAETLAALCSKLLYRHDLEGISQLLRPILGSYSSDEVSIMRKRFIEYILDITESAENVWESYELLNLAFPDTSVQTRTRIMKAFFDRARSDLACLVFGHMRQKQNAFRRPTAHTYAACLHGIAQNADADSLHLVHNMLKLDLEVGLSTQVFNALMLAYSACGMPEQAMEFFRDILHSEEGPSELTLVIFFRVCETHHNGIQEAVKMMEKLKSLDVNVDSKIYNAYIGVLGAHCEVERAVEAIRDMESQIGEGPSKITFGILYNTIPMEHWQDEAEKWARETFPEVWAELEETGSDADEYGLRAFKIERSIPCEEEV